MNRISDDNRNTLGIVLRKTFWDQFAYHNGEVGDDDNDNGGSEYGGDFALDTLCDEPVFKRNREGRQ